MKKILISLTAFASMILPMLASAQAVRTGYLESLITGGTTLLRRLLVFLIALAVVWFIWNVIHYTMSSDEEAKGKAKSQMIWGIIAIAVIVSVWGLVSLLQNMFGVNQGVNAVRGDFGTMIPGVK